MINQRSAISNRQLAVSIQHSAGFTLIELMITMVVFVLVIAAASGVFTGLLTQFKQQSKIAETNIEGIIGLEILRQDIEHAGYGLPWNLNGASYLEAAVESTTTWVDRDFNDGPPTNPARGTDPGDPASNPPGAIRSGDGYALNGSDVLVIKALNVATNFAAGKWQPIRAGTDSTMKTWWSEVNEYVCRNDRGDHYPNVRVIVISPGATVTNSRSLIVSGGTFFTQADNYSALTNFAAPAGDPEVRIMYGVDPDTDLRMPFNRADYYIRRPTTNMPQRCAPNTGILYKATVNQSDGMLHELPLLDCVADMQVVFRLDTDGDGTIDTESNNIFFFTAQQIRQQVKEARVYILTHEGQRDVNYTYPNSTVTVGEFGLGHTFNLATVIGTNWQNYRWKVYNIVVKLMNLG
jgi:prepilin-type N-terminal cleavage/methylation domain-containing protein